MTTTTTTVTLGLLAGGGLGGVAALAGALGLGLLALAFKGKRRGGGGGNNIYHVHQGSGQVCELIIFFEHIHFCHIINSYSVIYKLLFVTRRLDKELD